MKTVLYVDDSADDLLLFESVCRLAQVSFGLRTAAGGPQAIAYLSEAGAFVQRPEHPLPDLILLDLKMPVRDGFEVLRWVRANPSTHTTPVALYTASLLQEDIVRGYSAGATWFITKPSNMAQVMEMARAIDACLATDPVICQVLAPFSAPRLPTARSFCQ